MVKLLALTPCAGLLPVMVQDIAMTEIVIDNIASVAPYDGQNKAVSAVLKDQIGTGLTPANRATDKVQWYGHNTWIVRGEVTLDGLAAVTDQTDAWAVVQIAGPKVEDVLARLVPIDLRAKVFRKGHTARTMLGHMSVAVTRNGPQEFEVMAMRSMAGTMVHELETAARGVAARMPPAEV